MTKAEKEEVQMPSQVTVELECQIQSCNFDEHGNKFKTPPLSQHEALQLLKIHRAMDHGLRGAEVASDHAVQVDAVPETSLQVDKNTDVEVEVLAAVAWGHVDRETRVV